MASRHGIADQEISEPIAPVLPLRRHALPDLVAEWLSEYGNARTQERYSVSVLTIAKALGATNPAELTAGAVAGWAQGYQGANNTIRAHITAVRGFLRWSNETGRLPDYRYRPFQRLLKGYPPTYGKAQAPKPANRLDHDRYQTLLQACSEGTETGMRDELLVRLGVSTGIRVSELRDTNVGALRRAPTLTWTGKARKVRTAVAGPALTQLIGRYLSAYEVGLGRELIDDDPVFCAAVHSRRPHLLRWGVPITTSGGLALALRRRAELAGVGYLAPMT